MPKGHTPVVVLHMTAEQLIQHIQSIRNLDRELFSRDEVYTRRKPSIKSTSKKAYLLERRGNPFTCLCNDCQLRQQLTMS